MDIICSVFGHLFIEHRVDFWHCARCCAEPEIFEIVCCYPNGLCLTEYVEGADTVVERSREIWTHRDKNGVSDIRYGPTKFKKIK